MAKSKSFGGIPLSMAWYTGPFPGSTRAQQQSQPTRQQFPSAAPQPGATAAAATTAPPRQYTAPAVVNVSSGTGDSIELKLAPVHEEEYFTGRRGGGGGGGGWGDDLGRDEGMVRAWEDDGQGRGDAREPSQGGGALGGAAGGYGGGKLNVRSGWLVCVFRAG